MNGQMKSYKEKMTIVDEYLSRFDPYKKLEPLKFDLRGYAKYLKENNISGKNVSTDVVKMFQR